MTAILLDFTVPSNTPSVGVSFCTILDLSFLQHITIRMVLHKTVNTKNTPVVTPRIITYCFSDTGTGSVVVAASVSGSFGEGAGVG